MMYCVFIEFSGVNMTEIVLSNSSTAWTNKHSSSVMRKSLPNIPCVFSVWIHCKWIRSTQKNSRTHLSYGIRIWKALMLLAHIFVFNKQNQHFENVCALKRSQNSWSPAFSTLTVWLVLSENRHWMWVRCDSGTKQQEII